eukprot:9179941-Lingulodinium_polyedra.AAC.2
MPSKGGQRARPAAWMEAASCTRPRGCAPCPRARGRSPSMRPSPGATGTAWRCAGPCPGRGGSPGRALPSCRWPRRFSQATASPPAGCEGPSQPRRPALPRSIRPRQS